MSNGSIAAAIPNYGIEDFDPKLTLILPCLLPTPSLTIGYSFFLYLKDFWDFFVAKRQLLWKTQ